MNYGRPLALAATEFKFVVTLRDHARLGCKVYELRCLFVFSAAWRSGGTKISDDQNA